TLASARPRAIYTTATLVEELRAVQTDWSAGPPAQERVSGENDFHQEGLAPQPQPQPQPQKGGSHRSSKFFIELQQHNAAPAVETQVKGELLAGQAKAETAAKAKTESKGVTRAKKAADKFNQKVRRNLFIGLLIFTFLGVMVSLFNYVSTQTKGAPFGF